MAPINTSLPTVRTATVFITSSNCIDASTFPNHLSDACDKASALREALTSAGVDLQTTRVAVPGPAAFGSREAAIEAARALDAAPVDYASLGTVHPSDDHSFLDASFFTDVLSLTSKVFVSLTVTSSIGEPSHMATRLAAETISRLASLELSGLANMRFAALANVRAGCPFFPAAYAPSTSDASPSFPVALGVQAAPLLHAGPLHELPARVEKGARELVDACKVAGAVTLDFSTAPLPGMSTSAAAAVARSAGAGVLGFGKPGTLAAAAAVASKLDEAKFPRAGLCGVMLPVAEDSALAFCDRPLRLNDLLLASAVCGTGLDMIPLPGDTPVSVLQRVVADVAALSARLGRKQLTARLLPIPGKTAGDVTQFESPYLDNGPVLEVDIGKEGDGEMDELEVRPLPPLITQEWEMGSAYM